MTEIKKSVCGFNYRTEERITSLENSSERNIQIEAEIKGNRKCRKEKIQKNVQHVCIYRPRKNEEFK